MGGSLKKRHGCPKLLELIPKESEWMTARVSDDRMSDIGDAQEKKLDLELKLCLPGGNDAQGPSILSLGPFSELSNRYMYNTEEEGSSWKANCKGEAKQGAHVGSSASRNSDRGVVVPVVGWPPIRSYRKNLASSLKPTALSGPQKESSSPPEVDEIKETKKGSFVKINMDGLAIGRKVDLHAYDSYEKLSDAVEELFSGLLAPQRDSLVEGAQVAVSKGNTAVLGGLLEGGEYALVYQDNKGDRMLVGDVPWEMFVSTAKRLRILRSSELSAFSAVLSRKRASVEC